MSFPFPAVWRPRVLLLVMSARGGTASTPCCGLLLTTTLPARRSNLMDIPTDCPQRERRGWLGDAHLSFETVISNIDGGSFYTKWLGDLVDTQVYDNATMGTMGALRE